MGEVASPQVRFFCQWCTAAGLLPAGHSVSNVHRLSGLARITLHGALAGKRPLGKEALQRLRAVRGCDVLDYTTVCSEDLVEMLRLIRPQGGESPAEQPRTPVELFDAIARAEGWGEVKFVEIERRTGVSLSVLSRLYHGEGGAGLEVLRGFRQGLPRASGLDLSAVVFRPSSARIVAFPLREMLATSPRALAALRAPIGAMLAWRRRDVEFDPRRFAERIGYPAVTMNGVFAGQLHVEREELHYPSWVRETRRTDLDILTDPATWPFDEPPISQSMLALLREGLAEALAGRVGVARDDRRFTAAVREATTICQTEVVGVFTGRMSMGFAPLHRVASALGLPPRKCIVLLDPKFWALSPYLLRGDLSGIGEPVARGTIIAARRKLIERIRETSSLTQAQLAKRVGASLGFTSHLLSERRNKDAAPKFLLQLLRFPHADRLPLWVLVSQELWPERVADVLRSEGPGAIFNS